MHQPNSLLFPSWLGEATGLKLQMEEITSVMIYHRGASLSEQHNDLPCNWSLYKPGFVTHAQVDMLMSSPEIARYHIPMPTARAATLSVATYA